jgi:hypothetical protein
MGWNGFISNACSQKIWINVMSEWLKTHWPVFVAILAAGTAWGQQQTKIATLEQVVRDQVAVTSTTVASISTIKEQNARIEERLKIIIENQERALRVIAQPTTKR